MAITGMSHKSRKKLQVTMISGLHWLLSAAHLRSFLNLASILTLSKILIPRSKIESASASSPFHSKPRLMSDWICTQSESFLDEDVRAFEGPFFSISPLEAMTMDPQHRELTELTHGALENGKLTRPFS